MRLLAPLLLSLALFGGEGPAVPPAATTPAVPSQATWQPLLDAACANGFPDLRQATWLVGTVTVVHTGDDDRLSLGRISFGNSPSTSTTSENGVTTTTSTWDGLHARLPDGTWLVGLTEIPPAGAQVTPAADIRTCTLAELPALAQEHSRWSKEFAKMSEAQLAQQLESVPVEQRQQMRDNMQYMALAELTGAGCGLVHLIQAGLPGAACGLAMVGVWAGMRDNLQSPLHLGLPNQTRTYPNRVIREPRQVKPPDDVVTIANLLRTWYDGRVKSATTPAERHTRLAQARAFATATQANPDWMARVDLLATREALPTTAQPSDPLPSRLVVWEPSDQWGNERLQITPDMLARIPAEHRARMQEMLDRQTKGRLIQPADLAGLFALLGETAPSRWLENDQIVRTVGDNALRALGHLLHLDPRILVDRDPNAPWTAAERTATATALQAWYAERQGKPIDEILANEIVRMPLDTSAGLLAVWSPELRTAALDRLVLAWQGKPLPECQAESLARLLAATKGHSDLAAIASTWNGENDHALVLAVWRQMQGDAAPLDRLVESSLTNTSEAGRAALENALACAMRFPTPARLVQFLGLIGQDGAASEILARIAIEDNTWRNPARPLLEPERTARPNRNAAPAPQLALRLALCTTLLNDTRPLPAGMVSIDEDGDLCIKTGPHSTSSMRLNEQRERGSDAPKPVLATDLRLCDLTAFLIAREGHSLQLDYRRLKAAAPDLTKPLAERDAAVNRARELLVDPAADALKAASLPETLPGAKPAAAPDALF